jgi:hypothetical protein
MRRSAGLCEGEGMSRRFFILLSALSLVLCAATSILWVRSYWVADGLGHYDPAIKWTDAYEQHSWSLQTSRGRFYFFRGVDWPKHMEWTSDAGWIYAKSHPSELKFINDESAHWFGSHGLGVSAFSFGAVAGVEAMSPHWLVCAAAMMLPTARFALKWRSRRRIALGRCSSCGYDLRATPDHCPECGAVSTGGKAAFKSEMRDGLQ